MANGVFFVYEPFASIGNLFLTYFNMLPVREIVIFGVSLLKPRMF